MSLHEDIRYKSIVIPRIRDKYIVVQDKKFKEFTFVVGGCKRNESSVACALRELAEETRNAVVVNPRLLQQPSFTFSSRDRSKQELQADKNQKVFVTMVYNAFIVDVNVPFSQIKRLYDSKNFFNNKAYTETSGIYLMSYKELMDSPRTWKMMKENVLPRLRPSNRW